MALLPIADKSGSYGVGACAPPIADKSGSYGVGACAPLIADKSGSYGVGACAPLIADKSGSYGVGACAPLIADKSGPYGVGACAPLIDRKSTRLNSSHVRNSYAVLCLKKKQTGRSAPDTWCSAGRTWKLTQRHTTPNGNN